MPGRAAAAPLSPRSGAATAATSVRTAKYRLSKVFIKLSELIPGGHPKELSAAQATRILERANPSGAVRLPAPNSPQGCGPFR